MAETTKTGGMPKPSSDAKVQPPGKGASKGKAGQGLSGGVDTGAVEPGRTGSRNPK